MPDLAKDLEFLLAIVKTGSLTINYDAAATMLGWNKKKTTNKMSEFRKQAVSPNPPFSWKSCVENLHMLTSISCGVGKAHDWPINKDKDASQAGPAPKAAKGKGTKRTAAAAGDEEGEVEVKKPAAKRAKNKKVAKEEVDEDEAAAEEAVEEEGDDA
ncbi:hypothetical protein F5882DRAFT_377120 [Hyaloscypha sp. PMI_1271]|nr:hypothetical protein F5882DRAFT_377120 [Hyaloscypha sp. PMI_1271]